VKGDSVVSQTFSFTPDFTQGPGSVSVTFRAKDEKGVSTLKTVTININAVPQDLLVVSKDKGGVPGSKGKLVPLILTNLQDVYGVQFTLHYDSASVNIDSLVPASIISGFNIKSNLGDSSNQVTVLVFGLNNEIIPTGSDTLLYLGLSVDTLASSGKKPLTLTNAWEAISTDPNVPAKELAVTNGFFTVDKFGDLNLDTLVNIGDVVSLIAYILGTVTLNSRQTEAADINRDSSVNVGDLVGVINTILGRPINAPIVNYREPLAYLHLEYDSLQPGSSGNINVWADLKTSVAGVQLKIKYNPQQLLFLAPVLTSRSDSLDINYRDDGQGTLTVIFYRFSKNKLIEPGQGSILSLPVTAKSGFDNEKLQLSLKEAILADPTAVVIPVDKGEVVLPKLFSLGQNYPNPFNPTTTIRFEIGIGGGPQQSVQTSLRVYNILGQRVKTLVDEPKSPGIYYQTWDGKDEQGNNISSGVYFYQLRAGSYNETKKMVLLK
ncbi:MAG: cohesin domain-containing protein, partial [candidate division Zixibacteria bacterium]|nr:cohesin domain-containing protein [candidate division Zixibacteria bacterium]